MRKERGDTIVEVFIALSVVGIVLIGSYLVANRNLAAEEAAQERSVALRITQGQLELLKANPSSLTTFTNGQQYCVNNVVGSTNEGKALLIAGSNLCNFDSGGFYTTSPPSEPYYKVTIENIYTSVPGPLPAWPDYNPVKITVTWDSPYSTSSTESLETFYHLN